MAVTTAPPNTVSSKTLTERSHQLRNRLYGVAFILIALAIYWLFAQGIDAKLVSTYGLNQGNVAAVERVPDWVIPSFGTAALLAVASAGIGAYQLARGFGRATSVMLGLVALFFIFSFLTWATRDQSINLAGMLKTMVERSVPLTLGALSGILCERAGVVNIAIEGMMLGAAMMAAIIASVTHNLWLGVLGAILTGGLLALIHGVLSIRYKVDQIISGTVINIFATGMTSFIAVKFLEVYPELNNPGIFLSYPIPLLSKIPLIGGILFDANIFTYGAYILLVVIHVGLFYTRWGLRVRAVGEHPRAADTLGINVYRTRYINVILGG